MQRTVKMKKKQHRLCCLLVKYYSENYGSLFIKGHWLVKLWGHSLIQVAGSLLSQRSVLITLMAYISVIFPINFSGNKLALAAKTTEKKRRNGLQPKLQGKNTQITR